MGDTGRKIKIYEYGNLKNPVMTLTDRDAERIWIAGDITLIELSRNKDSVIVWTYNINNIKIKKEER